MGVISVSCIYAVKLSVAITAATFGTRSCHPGDDPSPPAFFHFGTCCLFGLQESEIIGSARVIIS